MTTPFTFSDGKKAVLALTAIFGFSSFSSAAELYFKHPTGASGPTLDWNSEQWSSNPDGSGTLSGWIANSDAVFWATSPSPVTTYFGFSEPTSIKSLTTLSSSYSAQVYLLDLGASNKLTITDGVIDVNNSRLEIQTTWGVAIPDGVNFTKKGSGLLIITNFGFNDFTGNTVIEEGTIQLRLYGVLAAGTRVSIAADAALDISLYDNSTYSQNIFGGISGSGSFKNHVAYNQAGIELKVLGSETHDFSGALDFSTGSNTGSQYFKKTGTGTQIFSGTASNIYHGNFQLEGGTLVLAKTGGADALSGDVTVKSSSTLLLQGDEQIKNSANLILDGGHLNLDEFSETVSLLTLEKSSAITLSGGGNDRLIFANSSGVTWGDDAVLTIHGLFDPQSIRFGTDATGLTSAQLEMIVFSSYEGESVQIDSNGYLFTTTMIPEPSSVLLLGAGAFGIACFWRRQSRSSC
jgi:autotransporter-associated beta strand protein